MSSVTRHFCIPGCYDDLEPVQTMEQALNALSILQETQEIIFQNIERRVQLESTRLASIKERINIANDKVLAIARDRKKKPTYVHSSAKYPIKSNNFVQLSGCDFIFGQNDYASHVNVEAPTTEHDNEAEEEKRYRIVHPQSTMHNDSSELNRSVGGSLYYKDGKGNDSGSSGPGFPTTPTDAEATTFASILDLYWRVNQTHHMDIHAESHEHVPNTSRRRDSNGAELLGEGLGLRMPYTISSVSSALLFNSRETPYFNRYTSGMDNLSTQERNKLLESRNRDSETEGKTIAEMPESLLKGDQLPSFQSLNYDYKPQMQSMEDTWGNATATENLAFGDALPAVADLSYDIADSDFTSIAPTAFKDQLPVLPSIMDSQPPPTTSGTSSTTNPTTTTANNPPQSSMGQQQHGAPPPPPPPPPPPGSKSKPIAPGLPPQKTKKSAPPVPSTMAKTNNTADAVVNDKAAAPKASVPPLAGKKKPKAAGAALPSADTGRMSLLAAIRNPNNRVKLKKKSEQVEKKPSKKLPPPKMDMASEMAAKLKRRRMIQMGKKDDMLDENKGSSEGGTTVRKARKKKIIAVKNATQAVGGLQKLMNMKKQLAKKRAPSVDSDSDDSDDWD